MKLSKLYCNNKDFKNITFNPIGLNVIYADVKPIDKSKKDNSHSRGKTKVAELIDFLLLKKIDNNDEKKDEKVKTFTFTMKPSIRKKLDIIAKENGYQSSSKFLSDFIDSL